MELSLMYDTLYTKATIVHSWFGYARIAGATALVMFWFHSKEGQASADVLITTYVLLATTVILDIRWLLEAVASTWTYSFLNKRPQLWLHHALLCSGKWRLLRHLIVSLNLLLLLTNEEPTKYRMWPGTIGQYNLLREYCTPDKKRPTGILSSVVKWIASEEIWMEYEYHYKRGLHISKVSGLFERIWENMRSAYTPKIERAPAPMYAKMAAEQFLRGRQLDEALDFTPAFQESILIWHIATVVFLVCSDQYTSSSKDVQAINALSNYMVFLVAVRPSMLPGLKLRSLYEAIHQALEGIFPTKELSGTLAEKMEKLVSSLIDMERRPRTSTVLEPRPRSSNWKPGVTTHKSRPENASDLYDKNIILSDGTSFARVMLGQLKNTYISERYKEPQGTPINLELKRYRRLTEMIPGLEDPNNSFDTPMSEMLGHIFKTWVRLLMYASVRCTRDSHARQLARGGELTTIVWILNEHAGIFGIDQSDQAAHGGVKAYIYDEPFNSY
uniref:DUF4220 domain-containing protein n=1 Tax=Leersia perrieri TaxID=77586 RepID=A0A0D9W228_9ORYZ